jgi:hypothetical protein
MLTREPTGHRALEPDAGMAVTMYVTEDPDSADGNVAASRTFALAFAALATVLHRPLCHTAERGGGHGARTSANERRSEPALG